MQDNYTLGGTPVNLEWVEEGVTRGVYPYPMKKKKKRTPGTLGTAIAERREDLGYSQETLADMIGASQATVDKIEHGRSTHSRYLAPALLALGMSLDLLPGAARRAPEAREPSLSSTGLPVAGEVAAGAWLDPEEADEPRHADLFVPPDPRWPRRFQRAYVVKGRSVEKTAKDGQTLVCVVLGDNAAIEPKDGDLVIAERRRAQGGLVERTAKRLRFRNGRPAELVPEYLDETMNRPISMKDDGDGPDDVEVAVLAVVIGVYNPLR